jgi:HSP20 family protein
MQTQESKLPQTQRSDVWSPFQSLHEEVDRLFSRYVPHRLTTWLSNDGEQLSWVAPMDVSETADSFDVMMDVPGLTDKEIEITLIAETLTVKGEGKIERDEKKANFHRVERSYGSFLRRIELPSEVQADSVSAVVEKGVLKIHLPKTPAAKAKETKIAIRGS